MNVKFLGFCVFTLAILLGLDGAFAWGAEIPEIRDVELYPSGARFIFAVNAPAGDVQFELPGAFDKSSVRVVSPEGLEGLQAVRRSRIDWVPDALSQIKTDYDAQQAIVAGLVARESSLTQTVQMLATLRPGTEQSGAGELITYIRDAQALKLATENELAALKPELEREREKLRLLKDELDRRSPSNSDSWLDVTGHLTGKTEVLFEARTDEATWKPHYKMALNSKTGAIHAQMYASVEQNTGLDYTGDILFHTRVPDDRVRTPKLDPLRVGLQPKQEARATGSSLNMKGLAAARPMMNMEMAVADAIAFDEDESVMRFRAPDRTPVVQAITLTDRAIKGTGVLPGDGSSVQFELGEIKLTCTPEFLLIPDQQNDAWILASMDNAPSELIPGEAELFVDGAPAGRTEIPRYGLAQAKLPFGRVSLLTATKEPLVDMTGSSWFTDSIARGVRIKITNGTAEDRTVTVRDRLPIPTNDKIKLEVRKIDPEPLERDKENRLTWKLEIKAGQTTEILVDYALNYPSGENLQYR